MGMTGEQAYVLAKKLIEAGGGGGGTVDAYTKTQTDNLLIQKVDKEAGKGLFSGSYNDLSDAPTIPTKTSELQNDSGYLTEQAVSDEWNDTTTYEVGQYCIFSNRLWKCLIQNSGEAPQEGTYWTQTSIDNEINELNSNLFDFKSNILHNIPRLIPKDITSYYNDGTLWKRLNGTNGFGLFEDIFVGDYFKMSRTISAYNQDQTYQTTGSDWVTIAGIDTMWDNGDNNAMHYHHLVMVPGKGGFAGAQHFGRSRMNPSSTTEGGYAGSEMHTTTIGEVTTEGSTATTATINQQLYAEFGSHLKTTRELLSTGINATGSNRFGADSGCANSYEWRDCQAVLMSEVEVNGSVVWTSSGFDIGNANVQLPLFANNKSAVNNRSAYYWLKSIASAADFCRSNDRGDSGYGGAAGAGCFVRPRFVIAA